VNLVYVSLHLIYNYVETADDNDDEIDRNPPRHFKDNGSLTPHTIEKLYETDKPLFSQYAYIG